VERIDVSLGDRSYPIYIGAGLVGDRALVGDAVPAHQVLIVTNDIVAPLYLEPLREALGDRNVDVLVLPDGEQHKTLATFSTIIDRLVAARFHRDACLAALGGGVVGDITGFAAACYQRGIDFIQVPTTLLAQVDSSVGGKTAVNHPRAKNMIGAFYQPSAVLADTDTLGTLPRRELAAGLAEVVKYGLILDRELFEWLEEHVEELVGLDAMGLRHAIRRSCEIKAAVVAEDERERGNRALLNLGHTFGHALESLGGYTRWLHGEAVAIGTALAARTSVSLGWLTPDDCTRIESLLARAGLPTRADGIGPEELLERMQLDKKAGRTGLKLVLLRDIGRAVIVPSPEASVLRGALATSLDA
jgi:3-dehydroquinate synthase